MMGEYDFLIKASDVRFEREGEDRVVARTGGHALRIGNVVTAFPLSRPQCMIQLRDEEGQEIGILDDIRQLDKESRRIVQEQLDRSYFMPRILDVEGMESKLGVETWKVVTDKGPRTFMVRRPRINVRKLGRLRLIIKDVDGNRYDVRNWSRLPPRAQRHIQGHL